MLAIGVILVLGGTAIIAAGCCKAAGRADRRAEELIKERERNDT